MEHDYPDKEEAIAEIKSTALVVFLPDAVIGEPRVRVFKTSKKVISWEQNIYKGWKYV